MVSYPGRPDHLANCVGEVSSTPAAPDPDWLPTATRTAAGHSSRTPPIRPTASWPRLASVPLPGARLGLGWPLSALLHAGPATPTRCPVSPVLAAPGPTSVMLAPQTTASSVASFAPQASPLRRNSLPSRPRIAHFHNWHLRLRGYSPPGTAAGLARSSVSSSRCACTPCISSASPRSSMPGPYPLACDGSIHARSGCPSPGTRCTARVGDNLAVFPGRYTLADSVQNRLQWRSVVRLRNLACEACSWPDVLSLCQVENPIIPDYLDEKDRFLWSGLLYACT